MRKSTDLHNEPISFMASLCLSWAASSRSLYAALFASFEAARPLSRNRIAVRYNSFPLFSASVCSASFL